MALRLNIFSRVSRNYIPNISCFYHQVHIGSADLLYYFLFIHAEVSGTYRFLHINPLVPELFCQKFDLLEIVSFSCTFLQHAVRQLFQTNTLAFKLMGQRFWACHNH